MNLMAGIVVGKECGLVRDPDAVAAKLILVDGDTAAVEVGGELEAVEVRNLRPTVWGAQWEANARQRARVLTEWIHHRNEAIRFALSQEGQAVQMRNAGIIAKARAMNAENSK